jgi:hypothetical protein
MKNMSDITIWYHAKTNELGIHYNLGVHYDLKAHADYVIMNIKHGNIFLRVNLSEWTYIGIF